MYADVLLAALTYPDATPEAAITNGVALARRIGGGVLTLLTIEIDIPPVGNALTDALFGFDKIASHEEARSAAQVQSEAASARLAAAALGEPIRHVNRVVQLYLEGGAVADEARGHDLCLLPVGDSVLASQGVAEAALFASGRPVIVYPETLVRASSDAVGQVIIAWDGSARAARAVADALPLLRRAASIEIFVAVEEKPQLRAGGAVELQRHLAVHGLSASIKERPADGRRIGDLLREQVAAVKADVLVMGAFGHARFREFVLGGATQSILSAPPCPVLMSH